MHLFQPSSHRRKKHFTIDNIIGEGAFGKVKLARWNTHHPPMDVALKIIAKSVVGCNHDDFAKKIERLCNWDHPHIVKCYEWFESRSRYYIVFEYAAKGEMFDKIVSAGHYTEEDSRKVLFALLDAVRYFHARNIVHRDLKPENILYRSDRIDDFVVADFGLAYELPSKDAVITHIAGSPVYTAPEIFMDKGYGLKADMWSIGIIAFVILSGRFPLRSQDQAGIIRETLEARITFPDIYWHDVSEEAKNFVKSLLVKDPAKRPSADEALKDPWFSVERCPKTSQKGVCPFYQRQPTISHVHNPDALQRVQTAISLHLPQDGHKEEDSKKTEDLEEQPNHMNVVGVNLACCRKSKSCAGGGSKATTTSTNSSTDTSTTDSTSLLHTSTTDTSYSAFSMDKLSLDPLSEKSNTSSDNNSSAMTNGVSDEKPPMSASSATSSSNNQGIFSSHRDITGDDPEDSAPPSRQQSMGHASHAIAV